MMALLTNLSGLANYGVFFLTLGGIYAILALGLNVQWGLTGQFNIGITGFFAVGAYATAILTTAASPYHLGGFGLSPGGGLIAAMLVAGLLALAVGLITVDLRTDYLAIATIAIAEIVRLVLKNEDWLTNGVRGIPAIPQPLADDLGLGFMGVVLGSLVICFAAMERARRSPWGRVLRAIRDNEAAVLAVGKDVTAFRLQAFVAGSMLMGLAGGLYAHFVGFISPEAFDHDMITFLVWVMLVVGGGGNNRGAVAGAFLVWLIWSGSEVVTKQLPPEWMTQAGAIRVFLVGLLVEVMLLHRPRGLLPERTER